MNRHRAVAIVRWLIAAGVGLWTARQFYLVGHAEDGAVVYGALHALYGFAGLLTSALLVGPELVDWGTAPVNRLFDAVLMPTESAPPPLDYTLAHFYRRQMRYEEACEEYFKVIRYHPRELPAYIEGMVTAGQARRTDLAARFFRLGRSTFREGEIRERLQLALDDARMVADAAAAAEAEATEATDFIDEPPLALTGDDLPPPAADEVSPSKSPPELPEP